MILKLSIFVIFLAILFAASIGVAAWIENLEDEDV